VGRGPSLDGIIGDEGLLLKNEKLDADLRPANRGNLDKWKHFPLHHAEIITSSMPYGQSGKWMLDAREQMKTDPTVFYDEATVFENVQVLGIDYIKQLRKSMTELKFRVEVLNERIAKVEDGFYPNLDENVHAYTNFDNDYLMGLGYDGKKILSLTSRMDKDCDTHRALEGSVDWGARINCLVVCQEWGREFRALKSLFVKHPDGIDELAEKFVKYYAAHIYKVFNFYYDRNGNNRQPNSPLTFAEQFANKLRKAGWIVYFKTPQGLDAYHHDKYLLWYNVLKETDPNLPLFRINSENCSDAMLSMLNAPVKDGGSGFKKDKSSEQSDTLPQEKATHFSDALDVIVYRKYWHRMKPTRDVHAPVIVM
jgi:hypothetical protein